MSRKSAVKDALVFLIPVLALLGLAAAALLYAFSGVSPLLTVSRALGGLRNEVTERTDATPLKALVMLPGILEDGAIAVDGNYGGVDFDFEAYISKERIAARSLLFDDNFYGFRYGSFRDDIRPFGRLIGLPEETMDKMADVIETLNEALNRGGAAGEAGLREYSELLSDFLSKCEVTSAKTALESGAGERCTMVSIVVSEEALEEALFDLLGGLEMSYSGDITLSFYIGRGDRMLRVEAGGDIIYDGTRMNVSAVFDFGGSVRDRWEFRASLSGSRTHSLEVTWDYGGQSGALETAVCVTLDGGDPITLKTSWSPQRGDFTMYLDAGDEFALETSGVFTEKDGGFRLAFDELLPAGYELPLALAIQAGPCADTGEIEFINLDTWADTLAHRAGELIDGLVADLMDDLLAKLVESLIGEVAFRLFGNVILESLGDATIALIGERLSGLIFDVVFDFILGRDLIYGLDRDSVYELAMALLTDMSFDDIADMVLDMLGDSLLDLVRDLVF